MKPIAASYTAFQGHQWLARGAPADVAVAARRGIIERTDISVLVFDDANGAVIDLDLRGSEIDVQARYALRSESASGEDLPAPSSSARGRGRPRLGVTSREITLLPRHWDWLATQPGGVSATLRRLVEDARRSSHDVDATRKARDAAYRFMAAIAGDLPGFEEAARALFADDRLGFARHIAAWPRDLRLHVQFLASHPD
ncbi:MAG: DUF2239 family protein [Janthinobacterium lividum]